MKLRKWPWGRIVAGVVAAAILLLVVPAMFSVVEIRRRADEARTAEPIHLRVDLSKPGEYRGEFRHTYNGGYWRYLQISTEPPPASPEDARPLVEGLTGWFEIVSHNNAVVDIRNFRPDDFECPWMPGDRWVPSLALARFPEGVYELTFTVTRGAPRLAGIPHALVGRYVSDGMEYVVAQEVLWAGSAVCALAGLLIVAVVWITLHKRCDNAK